MLQAKESGPQAAGRDEAETEGWLEASAGVPTLRDVEALLLPSFHSSYLNKGCEFSYSPLPRGPANSIVSPVGEALGVLPYLPRSPPCP